MKVEEDVLPLPVPDCVFPLPLSPFFLDTCMAGFAGVVAELAGATALTCVASAGLDDSLIMLISGASTWSGI